MPTWRAPVSLDPHNGWHGVLFPAGNYVARPSFAGGSPISAGRKNSVVASVQPSEIIKSSPMLAVPGWLDSHRLPKPDAVVSALKITARVRLDCNRSIWPARHAMTK